MTPIRQAAPGNRNLVISAVLVASLSTSAAAEPVSSEWVTKWQEDLDFAAVEFPDKHVDLYHSMNQEMFEADLTALRASVPELSHTEIIVELTRIVAAVNDGHTRLTLPLDPEAGFFRGHSSTPDPALEEMRFHHLPLRFYIFDDGPYVIKADEANADLIGSRIVSIGSLTYEEAYERVATLVHRDNLMQVRDLAPSRLVIPEVLAALGISEDAESVPFGFELKSGKAVERSLQAVPWGEIVAWRSWNDQSDTPLPLSLRDNEIYYWFEHLETEKAVYVQYNRIEPTEEENPGEFVARLEEFMEANKVEILILDIRRNRGGDNSLNRPLLHALIRNTEINQPGHLFVLIGRSTFSAAMMLTVDIERHTNAIFVGEPTGSRPNHYGDSRKVQLPNSGITVRLSSLEWQYGRPTDDRSWIVPHIPVEYLASHYEANTDPAMNAVLGKPGQQNTESLSQAASANGWFEGAMTLSPGTQPFFLDLKQSETEWIATLDLPGFNAKDIPLQNVVVEDSSLAFELPVQGGSIKASGVWNGERIYGELYYRGLVEPFVLWQGKRPPPAPDSE